MDAHYFGNTVIHQLRSLQSHHSFKNTITITIKVKLKSTKVIRNSSFSSANNPP